MSVKWSLNLDDTLFYRDFGLVLSAFSQECLLVIDVTEGIIQSYSHSTYLWPSGGTDKTLALIFPLQNPSRPSIGSELLLMSHTGHCPVVLEKKKHWISQCHHWVVSWKGKGVAHVSLSTLHRLRSCVNLTFCASSIVYHSGAKLE